MKVFPSTTIHPLPPTPPPPSIIMSKKDETFEFSNEKKFV